MIAALLFSAGRLRSLGGGKITDATSPYRREALRGAKSDNAAVDGHNVVRQSVLRRVGYLLQGPVFDHQ